MDNLPLIQLPMPEEKQPQTLYGRITNTNEPPKYDDIMNSNLPREEKARQIQYRTQAYQDDLDRQLHKDYARIGLGGLVSAVGALPIAITKNPVIGSAIGGGVYELGQGIMEGDELPELMQRSGFGAAIGGAAGGVVSKAPQAAKFVNDLSGGKIGNALKPIGDKITNSKLYDALMTDIKAFDPNKQTVYHGSPYDFNKFSNEAIGTGEGAQAHGYGHYAALDKDTAEAYAKNLSEGNKVIEYNGKIYKSNAEFKPNEYNYKMLSDVKTDGLEAAKNFYKDQEQWAREKLAKSNDKKWWEDTVKAAEGTNRLLDTVNPNLISDIRPDTGQLYKLSVPKDDVMLREGATFAQQPKKVQDILKRKYFDKTNENLPLKHQKTPEQILEMYGGNDFNNLRRFLINKTGLEGQELTNLLNSQGIKGISYNGGIDGEARVIFNPDDIVIGRKYYNQPNLYEQLTGKQNTGALVDALFNR